MTPEDLPWPLLWPIRFLANQAMQRVEVSPCPRCQASLPIPNPLPATLWETRLDCPGCGYAMALLELAASQRTEDNVTMGTIKVEEPANTQILTAMTSTERAWEIPARGGINFFIGFGVAWLLLCSFPNYMAACGKFSSQVSPWAAWVFLGMFNLVGFGMLYAGVRMSYSRHSLRLSATEFRYERRLFGRVTTKSLSPADIRSVRLVVFYSQNYEPVFGIEIQGSTQKIRFGSHMDSEEKAWLCQNLREALGLAPEMGPSPLFGSEARVTAPDTEPHLDEAEVKLPPAAGMRSLRMMGFIFALVAGFMLYKGLDFTSFGEGGPKGIFGLAWNSFSLLWCLGPAVMMFIGIGIIWFSWRESRKRVSLRTNRHGLVIETRCGHERQEERWSADEVTDIRAGETNWRINDAPTYSIYIVLPDRVRSVGIGQPRDMLQATANKLKQALR